LKISRSPGRISGPGIGDNSLAAAGLCGLVWALQEQRRSLPGDLWLVANVAEEGLGDLAGMRAVVDRFGQQPLAYLALEGMGYGRVYHRGLGVRRYRVTVNTQGGHSWVDFGKPSAIHELAAFITQLNTIILPVFPRTTLNAGVISGGTSVNTIASQAEIQLDLRSEDHAQLERLSTIVKDMVKSANREGVLVSAKVIGDRQAAEIGVNHVLVKLAQRVLENQGVKADLNIGSTDANVPLSRGLPAICIGLTRGGKAHTTREYIHTRPVKSGMEQLLGIVQGAYEALTQGPIREK
ncbi:MAG: M20/M25/M40 family metallo-hydrolase, partial [Anaerolineae bacterium]|nr:M20/M25/M40 family metallo-hydrolase [Anaerolineae bacterium]